MPCRTISSAIFEGLYAVAESINVWKRHGAVWGPAGSPAVSRREMSCLVRMEIG
jgi:hypothetical protein